MARQQDPLSLGMDVSEIAATQSALKAVEATIKASVLNVQALQAGFASVSSIQSAQIGLGVALQEQAKTRVTLAIQESAVRKEMAKAMEAEFQKQRPASFLNKATLGAFGQAGGAKADAGVAGGSMGAIPQALASLGPAALAAGAGLIAFKSIALASPGAMERFTLVLEDMAAVVGQTLIPVVEFLTSIAKTFGDILATVLPPASSLREILEPISETFRQLAEALAPILDLIRNVLIVALKALAIAVQIVMIPFRILAEFIKGFLGMEDKKLKSSTGAAARSLSFTSADAGMKAIYASAYKTGGQGGIETTVGGISETLSGIAADVGAIARKIGAAVSVLDPTAAVGGGIGSKVLKDIMEKDAAKGGAGKGNLFDFVGIDKPKPASGPEALGNLPFDKQFDLMNKTQKRFADEINKSGGNVGAKREKEMLEALRDIHQNHWMRQKIDQAKRRAMDGHPGGA